MQASSAIYLHVYMLNEIFMHFFFLPECHYLRVFVTFIVVYMEKIINLQ